MKTILVALVAGLFASSASAACYGSKSFQTCSDDSGNNYTVQRFGNSTYMQGYNANTGSSWSQNSQTYGKSTFHNGVDANGNSWNSSCYNGICN